MRLTFAAPTPTAAAELAVPVRSELAVWLAGMEERRLRALSNGIVQRQQRLRDLSRALPNPADVLALKSQYLDMFANRLPRALHAMTQGKRVQLVEKTAALRPQSLQQAILQKRAVLSHVSSGLAAASKRQVERWRDQLNGLERLRQTLGYEATLERGYAVVRSSKGTVLATAKAAKSEAVLDIQFKDGFVKTGTAQKSLKPVSKPRSKPKTTDQGNLF